MFADASFHGLVPTETLARAGDALTDSLIFGAGSAPIREVLIGGRAVVRDGHHAAEERIAAAYRRSLDRVLSAG